MEAKTLRKIDEIMSDVKRLLRQPRKEQTHLAKAVVRKLENLKEELKNSEGVS